VDEIQTSAPRCVEMTALILANETYEISFRESLPTADAQWNTTMAGLLEWTEHLRNMPRLTPVDLSKTSEPATERPARRCEISRSVASLEFRGKNYAVDEEASPPYDSRKVVDLSPKYKSRVSL